MGFINASLSTHVKTPKPKCEQTNKRTNNTHTHISTAIDRQTDLQPTKKMKMMLPATKVLVSMLAFSACLSQTARVSFASTITPFQDVEGGLAGVGQDLVSEFGGGIQWRADSTIKDCWREQSRRKTSWTPLLEEETCRLTLAMQRTLRRIFLRSPRVSRPLVKTWPMLPSMEGETCRLTLAMQRTSRRIFLR